MDQVEEIKGKTDIVNLIGERVKLDRAGRNFKALCPFHGERTPSFIVSPELQIYKCFGCGKGGDVFKFLNDFEGMEFPEALSFLAQKAGIKLQSQTSNRTYKRKELLREINHLASEFYHYLLTGHEAGKKAMRYLGERGIRSRAMKYFKLGCAVGSRDSLTRYLAKKKGYKLQDLKEVGLIGMAGGRSFDRFRDRIIFPLRDTQGNVIGFSGRLLPDVKEGGGKYINSPETELYHKSQHLFGIYENKGEIKKKDSAILAEGELDVISSWQMGVGNVVAVKGTALTKEQIELLRKYTRNIVLSLDTDMAGEVATKRGIALADEAAMNISVAILKEGKDPDELVQSDPRKWRKTVKNSKSVYDFYLVSAKKRFDLQSGMGKKQASEEIIPVLSKINNSVVKAHYVKKFSQLVDVSDDIVMDEIRRYEKVASLEEVSRSRVTDEVGSAGKKLRSEVLEDYLLSMVLQNLDLLVEDKEDFSVEILKKPIVVRILSKLFECDREDLNISEFIESLPTELREAAQSAYLKELDIEGEDDAWKDEYEKVVDELSQIRLKDKLSKISAEIAVLEKKKSISEKEKNRLQLLRENFSKVSQDLSR